MIYKSSSVIKLNQYEQTDKKLLVVVLNLAKKVMLSHPSDH